MSTVAAYRYPGVLPFQDNEVARLTYKGREEETQSLFHMVLTLSVVVLYAESGIGKTSLLNAGLMELLRQRELIPLTVRFSTRMNSPVQAVLHDIGTSLDQNKVEYKPGEEKTLWQFFKTVEFWSAEDVLLTPVLILDQFEELFTLCPPEGRREFITQLADLVRNRIPQSLRDSLREGSEFPYTETAPRVKIIIAIREDFLGELDELCREIPDIRQNTLRLVALTREQAQRAIEEPAQLKDEAISTPSFTYTPEAVEEMLDFLCTSRVKGTAVNVDVVMPYQLQVLCGHFEEQVLETGKTTIELEDLGGKEGLHRVMRHFYDREVGRLHSALKRRRVHRLFEKGLLTETDRRLKLDEEDIKSRFKVPNSVLDTLVDGRLLLRSEYRDREFQYELSHDTLVAPIRESERRRKIIKGSLWGTVILCLVVFAIGTIVKFNQNLQSVTNQSQQILAVTYLQNYVQNCLQEATNNLRKKNYPVAIGYLSEAIRVDPGNADAYLTLGNTYSELAKKDRSNLAEAARYYEIAIRYAEVQGRSSSNFYYADAYLNLANTLSEMGNYPRAEENYRRAIQHDPESAQAYNGLGYALYQQHRYQEAITNYKLALKLHPRDDVVRSTMSNLEKAQKEAVSRP